MKNIKRIRYYTMNCWNRSTAPAYNIKVYRVCDHDIQDKIYDVIETDEYQDIVHMLIDDFAHLYNYAWQAGINGRSGGYLVLYRGGKHTDGRPFSYPGKHITDEDVPENVLKAFHQLAIDIVENAEYYARNYNVVEKTYQQPVTYLALEAK